MLNDAEKLMTHIRHRGGSWTKWRPLRPLYLDLQGGVWVLTDKPREPVPSLESDQIERERRKFFVEWLGHYYGLDLR